MLYSITKIGAFVALLFFVQSCTYVSSKSPKSESKTKFEHKENTIKDYSFVVGMYKGKYNNGSSRIHSIITVKKNNLASITKKVNGSLVKENANYTILNDTMEIVTNRTDEKTFYEIRGEGELLQYQEISSEGTNNDKILFKLVNPKEFDKI